jgi:hypothetical protein
MNRYTRNNDIYRKKYYLSIHSISQLYFDNSLSSLSNFFNIALHSDLISRLSTVIPIEEKLWLKSSIWQFNVASSLIEIIPGFILGPPLKIRFLKNPVQRDYTYFLGEWLPCYPLLRQTNPSKSLYFSLGNLENIQNLNFHLLFYGD